MTPHYLIVISITKLKEICFTTSCFLSLYQHSNSASKNALLNPVFTNINYLCFYLSGYPVVASDNYHPTINLVFKLTFDFEPAFLTLGAITVKRMIYYFTIVYFT